MYSSISLFIVIYYYLPDIIAVLSGVVVASNVWVCMDASSGVWSLVEISVIKVTTAETKWPYDL